MWLHVTFCSQENFESVFQGYLFASLSLGCAEHFSEDKKAEFAGSIA